MRVALFPYRTLAVLLLLVSFCLCRAVTFIPAGATWRFLDDGSNQSNAWRFIEYEDDGWSIGPAQFGYGDGDEATEVSFGTNSATKFITTYFRRLFTVTDSNAVTNLVLRLLRDDGAIVYLNGVEVFRSNLPTNAVTYTTRAEDSIGGSDEDEFISTNLNHTLLVNGPNLIAVEVHQDSQSSSDLSFDLELTDGRSDSPVVTITSPANNAAIASPGDITLSIAASDPNGSVTNVQVFSGNNLIGESSTPQFMIVWSNVLSGTHMLTALARDDDGLVTLSPAVKITVGYGWVNLTLVPLGAEWRYLDNGSDQNTAWRALDFDDTGWISGPAKLGYGDSEVVTIVSFGSFSTNKYATTYFRRPFTVSNPAAVSDLVLRLQRDDGAIVYLNSNEVFRSNMPTGAVTYTTFASSSLSAPDEDAFVRSVLNKNALTEGTNILAVELHQANRTSGDLGLDLELLGSDFPRVLRGPWLQSPTITNILVKWRTDASVSGVVRFGLSPSNLPFTASAAAATDHRIELTNLASATKYYYSIGTAAGAVLGGADYYFVTPPLPGTRKRTRFWALGDCGTANADQFNVRDAAYRALGTNELDLVLLLGDNAYNSGTDSEYQRAIFD
ncbi:MAG TPA: Ig-like domain-containing protein, partial [Candidatus Acidoferrum sp.]|nr:Ig-like domain-containing protein [Candidatus Acidoferrum sp.]